MSDTEENTTSAPPATEGALNGNLTELVGHISAGISLDSLQGWLVRYIEASLLRRSNRVPGQIVLFAGPETGVPEEFLVCNGQEVSRVDYADLFTVIGTIHGAGDGASTFNLPDLRDKFALGASATRETASAGGSFTKTGETDGHVLTVEQMPRHRHSITEGTNHVRSNSLYVAGSPYSNNGRQINGTYMGNDEAHNHSITDFDVTPPYYALAYIIRT